MTPWEPLAGAIGEGLAWFLGRVLQKTIRLDARRAQDIGETAIVSVVLGAAVVVTLVYS